MRESIIEHLVCPQSGAPLRLQVSCRDGEHVIDGELVNQEDGQWRYPIRNGVPRFVNLAQLQDHQQATVEAFSYKWSRIPTYAHEQRTKANRERWYCERFGFFAGDRDIRQFLASAEFVLEAGTGTGVDTDLLARNFSGHLFGIDISSAIDMAYERFRDRKQIALLQADIERLPFRPESFDVISCDQVLHHTPDPPENFRRLIKLLRAGGRMLLYVYRIKGPIREFADDYLRGIFTKAPVDACVEFSEKMARLGKNLSQLRAKVEIDDDIPELGLQRGSYDVQRLIYDHVLKCFWNDEYDVATNAMINFDWYRPLHAFRYREEDLREWARSGGLTIEHLHVCPSGISTIMKKA